MLMPNRECFMTLKANKKIFEKLWEEQYFGRQIVSPETAARVGVSGFESY